MIKDIQETIVVNSPEKDFFDADFVFIEHWLKTEIVGHINDDLYQKNIITSKVLWKAVINKHVVMGFKLDYNDRELDGYKLKSILQTQIRVFGTGYRAFYTFDHPIKELTILAFPYYKADKLIELPNITNIITK